MSVELAESLVTLGYGLKSEDLDEIIVMERLRDVSSRFAQALSLIGKQFISTTRIRIIEFDRGSGIDKDANAWFNALADSDRHLYFSTIHSNKDCCVIFLYAHFQRKPKVLQERLLPHEFAHYYQWQTERFPFLVLKGCPKELVPQFADCYDFGPEKGLVYVDETLVDENCFLTLRDFIERESDYICEMILKQKGFWKGILNEYKAGRIEDPAVSKWALYLNEAQKKYVRRLAMYDAAEWEAMLSTAFAAEPTVQTLLRVEKEKMLHLNRDFGNVKTSYDAITHMILRTDYLSLKDVSKMIEFLKNGMKILNISIKTTESW